MFVNDHIYHVQLKYEDECAVGARTLRRAAKPLASHLPCSDRRAPPVWAGFESTNTYDRHPTPKFRSCMFYCVFCKCFKIDCFACCVDCCKDFEQKCLFEYGCEGCCVSKWATIPN